MAAQPPSTRMVAGIAAGDLNLAQKRRCDTDWSDLLPEILILISSYLTTIWDYVRFRGVCSTWRSVADRPPQTPYLLLPYDLDTAVRSFLDPYTRRITTIDMPEARGRCIYGGPHGWLVTVGQHGKDAEGRLFDVLLLNLITRAQISLPPLKDPITTNIFFEAAIYFESAIYRYIKTALSANPASSSHQKVFLALLLFDRLAICGIGEETWTVISMSVRSDPRVMMDCAYFDGAFYAVDGYKGITVVSIKSLKKRYSAPPSKLRSHKFYLVEYFGDLLLITRNRWKRDLDLHVFKLDRSKRKLKWVSIDESIVGTTLFVGHNCSSISLSSRDFVGVGQDLACFGNYPYNGVYAFYPSSLNMNLCILNIVAGNSIKIQPNYLQGSSSNWGYTDKTSFGLTWITPRLC